MNQLERALGGFLGLGIGDSIGAQVEFKQRGTFPEVTDMVGGGVFNLRPGQITDDTEMALAIARSLVARQGLDPVDIMDRFYSWSLGAFDVGNTIMAAIHRYSATGEPFQGRSLLSELGNGTIMRMYPGVLWSIHLNDEESFKINCDLARLTHASSLVYEATQEMLKLIRDIFAGKSKEELMEGYRFPDEISSSGFVKHTLEAALWGFATTNSFEEGLLKVVNLGNDADTVGAVYGQIAGSYYGRKGLPEAWVNRLECRQEIETLTRELLESPRR